MGERLPTGAPKFESTMARPTPEDIQERANKSWETLVHYAVESEGALSIEREKTLDKDLNFILKGLSLTAEEADKGKNPDSVAEFYPGYTAEDFRILAEILKNKRKEFKPT